MMGALLHRPFMPKQLLLEAPLVLVLVLKPSQSKLRTVVRSKVGVSLRSRIVFPLRMRPS
jgi:hypothetical protein